MKILIDENLPKRIKAAFEEYEIYTIRDMQWQGKKNGELMTSMSENQFTVLDFKKEYFDIVHQGMRLAVTAGTATSLNVPYVQIAAKTGTAQLGITKNKVNSWIIGFFPYQNPKYAFAIMMESGPNTNNVGAPSIMRQLLDWMSINTPEYFK